MSSVKARRPGRSYKGVCGLLLRQECTDWTYSREPINATISADQWVDIALIFPKGWCVKNGIEPYRQNSIVNKTLLTNRTRRIMGSLAPADYLRQLEAEAGLPGNWLDDIVATHLIDPKTLRANNFDGFYRARSAALLALIEAAMGRRAVPSDAAPESVADYQQELAG